MNREVAKEHYLRRLACYCVSLCLPVSPIEIRPEGTKEYIWVLQMPGKWLSQLSFCSLFLLIHICDFTKESLVWLVRLFHLMQNKLWRHAEIWSRKIRKTFLGMVGHVQADRWCQKVLLCLPLMKIYPHELKPFLKNSLKYNSLEK